MDLVFDRWIILNNLPDWCRLVDMVKNGKAIFSLNRYNEMVNVKPDFKGKLHYTTFVCSKTQLSSSLKN